jgi:parvulin-like peptidyl-prolyl isomerase
MRRLRPWLTCATLAASCALPVDRASADAPRAEGPADAVVDRIVAVVDDQPVTLFELRRAAAPFLAAERQKGDAPEVFRAKAAGLVREALDGLINDLLIFAHAKTMELEVDGARVDAHLEKIRQQNGWEEEELADRLRQMGFASIADYRRHAERELLKSQVVNAKVLSRARVDEREVEAELARELAVSGKMEERRASHILILLPELAPPEEVEAAMSRLREVREAIVGGVESFAELARRVSDDGTRNAGGDLGWFVRGDFDPSFEQVVHGLAEGEVSAPFRTPFGVHLAVVTGLRKREMTSQEQLETARRRIRLALREREVARIYRQWIRGLRQDAFVSVRADLGL